MVDQQASALDYEMDAVMRAASPAQMRALANPVRANLLHLVVERAASIGELAEALELARSTVAYHVDVLVDSGLMKVVRTRRVRAIEERFYGRTARTFVLGSELPEGLRREQFLIDAIAEVGEEPAYHDSTLRFARMSEANAVQFFARVVELAEDFTSLPAEGETIYGFVAATFATNRPTLSEVSQ